METIGSPLLWLVFAGVVIAALLIDLVLMRHGGPHKVTFREAAWWSLGWVALAMAFNAWLWWYAGEQYGSEAGGRIGMEFLTGYLVEKALAVDNIFVFLMIFGYFAVPEEQRQRVLVIGIVGAIALRAVLIFVGALLLAKFHWILYLFGAFLLFTGIKMWRAAGEPPSLEGNPVLRWVVCAGRQFEVFVRAAVLERVERAVVVEHHDRGVAVPGGGHLARQQLRGRADEHPVSHGAAPFPALRSAGRRAWGCRNAGRHTGRAS